MASLITVNNLYGGYDKKIVIEDASFTVEEGDFLGILGANGSGKSTLLKLMTKALPIIKGEVLFKDKNINNISLKELSQHIGFVSQNTVINFPFTVEEIVLMGRIPHLKRLQTETKLDYSIAQRSLQLTKALDLKDRLIDQLSAGEKQRVILAKALAQEPSLLFLDEPTSHLDIGHQISTLDLLRNLNRKNKITVIMVLHDLNLASEYCNRIILLNEGKVFKQGTPQEVLTYVNIETLYKTIVLVRNNPLSNKPYVIVVPRT